MTRDQELVIESLSRGRLVFPFMAEMDDLHKQARTGPLIRAEQDRLEELRALRKNFRVHDDAFHASVKSVDFEAAERHAIAATILCHNFLGEQDD